MRRRLWADADRQAACSRGWFSVAMHPKEAAGGRSCRSGS
ncbi:hypothetical protein BRYFOR_05902 [Marvinbryantia formatexigens DSM 14469]|uniref:Uncharacterized protein n=1 Tax=Marvinbryantia formatexigens DSM 14469 TaxID=478749 RepID=C6LBA7_9FIRM|nr:hypothetical protein BRYFOR_05902 [Marvinbryantia formatexigens DSM 14469]